jgi:putative FmdB family regulatory protein
MPTYEYACPRGHRFERFVRKISDADPAPACPECGETASRLISGAGLVFKGSGFYITDYGKDGKKKQEAPAAKGESAKGESAKGEAARGESGKGDAAKSDAPAAAPKTESTPAPKPKGGE